MYVATSSGRRLSDQLASVIRGHRHSAAASDEEPLSFAQAARTMVCDRVRASTTKKIEY